MAHATRSHNQPHRSPRHGEQGAIFLLSAWLISFTLLVLTSAMFVRSTNELRMAERSAEMHQAFWLAEGGMDQGLHEILWDQPRLPPGGCKTYTPASLSSTQSFNYEVCLQAENVYTIEANGVQGSTTQQTALVSGLLERETPELNFKHAIYAKEGITLRSAWVSGSIAASSSSAGAVKMLSSSLVQGDVYLPDDPDPNAVTVDATSRWFDQDGDEDGAVKQLNVEELGDLIPVVPPVKQEGLIKSLPGQAEDGSLTYVYEVQNTPGKPCWQSGTYFVKGLSLTNSAVCTRGPVDLYVQGSMTVNNSYFAGEPMDANPLLAFSLGQSYIMPENLRIFVSKASDADRVTLTGMGLTGAVIYAPDTPVYFDRGHRVIGSVMSKRTDIGASLFYGLSPGYGGSAAYDVDVGKKPVKYSPTLARVAVLLWGHKGAGKGLGKFFEVLPPPPAETSGGYQNTGGIGGGCNGGGFYAGL